MRLAPYRKIILSVEFTALSILIGSMLVFPKIADGKPLSPVLWLIPIAASFLVISGFAANLYLRWIENPDTQAATKTQKAFVYLVILSLYTIWFIAIGQAWILQLQLATES
jgi:hypothetical protein